MERTFLLGIVIWMTFTIESKACESTQSGSFFYVEGSYVWYNQHPTFKEKDVNQHKVAVSLCGDYLSVCIVVWSTLLSSLLPIIISTFTVSSVMTISCIIIIVVHYLVVMIMIIIEIIVIDIVISSSSSSSSILCHFRFHQHHHHHHHHCAHHCHHHCFHFYHHNHYNR